MHFFKQPKTKDSFGIYKVHEAEKMMRMRNFFRY